MAPRCARTSPARRTPEGMCGSARLQYIRGMAEMSMEHGLFPRATGVEAVRMLAAQLGVSDLVSTPENRPFAPDRVYASNNELWADLLIAGLTRSAVVRLPDYWLSEWFPLSPGLFHTPEAARNRRHARRHLLTSNDGSRALGRVEGGRVRHRLPASIMRQLHEDAVYVYDPHGKVKMVGGGIGSVRLKPKQLPGGLTWFMGASSTPVAHEGIPVALPDGLYRDCIDRLSSDGAVCCTLTGRLMFLPQDFEPLFRGLVGIPQVYVDIEHLEVAPTARANHFLASGAVMVQTGSEGPTPDYFDDLTQGISAAYVSFLPGHPETIELAAEWLAETYVHELLAGRVITDFDEQVRRFEGAAFSLNRIMHGQIPISEAENLLDRCGAPGEIRQIFVGRIETMNTREVVMHHNRSINIGAGATINAPVTVADSIEGSFNRLEQSTVDPELTSLLRDLGRAVVEAAQVVPSLTAEQMARDVQTLTTELTSEAPRAPWYRLALESLRETAMTVGSAATPVVDLIAKIAPLV